MFKTLCVVSGVLAAMTAFALSPPEQLTAYRDGVADQMILRWQSNADVDSYRVNWAAESDGPFLPLATTTEPAYSDSGLQAMRFYAVTAFDSGVESGLSNKCGYITLSIPPGDSLAFGLCFRFWATQNGVPVYDVPTTRPSDIFGEQLACGSVLTGDLILRQDNGYFAFREMNSGCAYHGRLESDSAMTLTRAYWYIHRGTDTSTVALAGQVIEPDEDCGVQTYVCSAIGSASAWAPISWCSSHSLDRNALGLISSGFDGGLATTSDKLVSQVNGHFCWYRTSNSTWVGTLATIEPGHAYFIVHRQSDYWLYHYNGSGMP